MPVRYALPAVMLLCGLLPGALLTVLQANAAPAGTTYYVGPGGSNANACTAPGAPCATIGGAVAKAAAAGDLIMVAAGTYHEHTTIDKSVTVSGAGADNTIVDGDQTQRVLTITFGFFVTLSGLQVRNGSAATYGGGILNNGTLTLNNVSVVTNTAAYGGGIYNAGALALVNTTVLSNSAGNGGGIYNFGAPLQLASLTLSGSIIDANHALTDGGGIYSSHNVSLLSGSANVTAQSTTMDANTAERSGAGIYSNGTLLVSGGNFNNGRSNDSTGQGGGGGLYIETGLAALTSTAFYNNSTFSGYGGGIYNFSGTLTISSTNISFASAARGGGLATGPGGSTQATNSDFSHATAFYGGAVENRGTLSLTGLSLHENRADTAGGAIYSSGNLTTQGGSVLNNTARGALYGGGGIYLDGGAARIDGLSMIGNSANLTYTESGGGIYVTSGAWLTLTHSQLNNNQFGYLGQGGGIAAYSSTLALADVSLIGNSGGGAGYGGGLYLQNVTATLSALTVNGSSGLYAGGGIYGDHSHITLANSAITGNSASAYGGGIGTFMGTLDVALAAIDGNVVGSDGGGIDLENTQASIISSTVSRNRAVRNGGGINHSQNTLALSNVTLSGNVLAGGSTQGDGGAVYNASGVLNGDSATLDHNSALWRGGGIYNASNATTNLTNMTLSANTAITGGGIYNQAGFISPAIITLTNVTLKDNSAVDGGGVFNANDTHNFVYLKNTVIADSPGGGNCKGRAFTAAQYSLSSDGTCVLSGVGNQPGTPAQLNPLANNGGHTLTHLPKPASPLVDGVGGSDCPSVDQRGDGRPQGASCDIGAVERQPADPALSPSLYLPVIVR